MPDWSYRTVLRPLLYAQGPRFARGFALEAMGTLARLPGGRSLIGFLGHMRSDPRLRITLGGIEFGSPIGLGPSLDVEARATPALERFGVGFIEVGPVTSGAAFYDRDLERDDDRQAVRFGSPRPQLSVAALCETLRRDGKPQVPLLVRLGASDDTPSRATDEGRAAIEALHAQASVFIVGTLRTALDARWSLDAWQAHLASLVGRLVALQPATPLWLALPSDRSCDELEPWIAAAAAQGITGFVVDGARSTADGKLEVGRTAQATALKLTTELRRAPTVGRQATIVAAGGIHSPREAAAFRRAGADLVEIDVGLVFSGPGLIKRCNEAFVAEFASTPEPTPREAAAAPRLIDMAWLWSLLIGLSVLLGGGMALAIAFTNVLLPYDEALTGLTRERLAAINERLLDFMTHDRTSLSGVMFTLGLMYMVAAVGAIRRGRHWAYVAVAASAVTGTCTFFAFLGFGYFDPFHAFVTAIGFQLQLTAIRGLVGPSQPVVPDWDDDRAWRLAQWGQLINLVHAAVLIGAGCVILAVGCSFVLIQTDLDYLCTTADALHAAHPQLLPLIAHDRAALGGMLLSVGIMFGLSSLWGFRRGERTVWLMTLALVPGYLTALVVHLAVGYDDLLHLLPVLLGLATSLASALLAGTYLTARSERPLPSVP